MRFLHSSLVLFISLAVTSPLFPRQFATTTQSSPQRDPQAVALLQASVASMGILPADSVATGTLTISAGSSIETGKIRILTRGTDQTSEEIGRASCRERV